MRDAEGHPRLALRTLRDGVPVHINLEADVLTQIRQQAKAHGRSLSREITYLLKEALADDAITAEEGRLILRALKGLADLDADEATMDTIERLTGKLEKAFPPGVS
jgi:hypothetical protein